MKKEYRYNRQFMQCLANEFSIDSILYSYVFVIDVDACSECVAMSFSSVLNNTDKDYLLIISGDISKRSEFEAIMNLTETKQIVFDTNKQINRYETDIPGTALLINSGNGIEYKYDITSGTINDILKELQWKE